MNIELYQKTLRFITNNPDEWCQSSVEHCFFAHAAELNPQKSFLSSISWNEGKYALCLDIKISDAYLAHWLYEYKRTLDDFRNIGRVLYTYHPLVNRVAS